MEPDHAMMTTPETARAVAALLGPSFLVMGLSHLLQPEMWRRFFMELAERGEVGVLWRTALFELWPAVLILAFHWDWRWPGALITLYGVALSIKVSLSMLFPQIGLWSLRRAETTGAPGFVLAGAVLLGLGGLATARGYGAL